MKPSKVLDIIKDVLEGEVKITLKSGKEFTYDNGTDDEATIEAGDVLKLSIETELNKWQIIYIDCDDISAICFETN